jgi:hypothetical protein
MIDCRSLDLHARAHPARHPHRHLQLHGQALPRGRRRRIQHPPRRDGSRPAHPPAAPPRNQSPPRRHHGRPREMGLRDVPQRPSAAAATSSPRDDRVLSRRRSLPHHDLTRFGELMHQAQLSFRDDFEASCPEIDILVDSPTASPAASARASPAEASAAAPSTSSPPITPPPSSNPCAPATSPPPASPPRSTPAAPPPAPTP